MTSARYRRTVERLKDNLGDTDTVEIVPRRPPGDDTAWRKKVVSRWTQIFTGLFGPPPARG